MKLAKTIILALSLAAGGCSVLEYKPVSKESLVNAQGHVIGHKEVLRDRRTGEHVAKAVLYVPRFGERGTIVAYEERVKGGAVLRDLNGKRIGNRWVDLRSRGTNARNSGLTIVFRPQDSERLAVAQLTIEELKQLLQLPN